MNQLDLTEIATNKCNLATTFSADRMQDTWTYGYRVGVEVDAGVLEAGGGEEAAGEDDEQDHEHVRFGRVALCRSE